MNTLFFPMLIQGMAGFHRRWYNGGDAYLTTDPESANVFGQTVYNYIDMNILMSWSAWLLCAAQIPFIINFLTAWKFGKKVPNDNPWGACSLEWATPTPPPHGNFDVEPIAYRGSYEYARPEVKEDYYPQWKKPVTKVDEDQG